MMRTERAGVTVAQMGARRHYAVPVNLHSAGILQRFYSDFCLTSSKVALYRSVIPSLVRTRYVNVALDREIPGVPEELIRSFPLFALKREWAARKTITSNDRMEQYLKYNRQFCELVAGKGFAGAKAVYVFNGAGLEIMRKAKAEGLKCILDQTSAGCTSEQKLLQEESSSWEGWSPENSDERVWQPMAEREQEEWSLADMILCGSEYAAKSVSESGGPFEKCKVLSYGIRGDQFKPGGKRDGGPLNVLVVGSVRLGKGIQYVMNAAELLSGREMQIKAVGPIQVSGNGLSELRKQMEVIGSVPRSEVQSFYDWADVLVHPSLSEGSSNVCFEALKSGLPVITTFNSGSVIRDGKDGFIVPIRSAEAIAEKLEIFLSDRKRLSEMSAAALERAEEFSWDTYRGRLVSSVLELIHG